MNTRRRIVMLTVTVALCSLSLVQAATVGCAGGDVACLVAALQAANATPEADTILLAAGTYALTQVWDSDGIESYGLPVVTGPLTIAGAGAEQTVIERATAGGLSLIGVNPTGDLTLQGLTLRGGLARAGAAVKNYGTARLSAVRLVDHLANQGGAVLNAGTMAVTDSVIEDSGVRDSGGGGLFNEARGTLVLERSTVIDNATGRFGAGGGGLHNLGVAEIRRSAVISNAAEGCGGIENTGDLTITHTTIAGNGAAFAVGGICAGGTVTIRHSTIVDNGSGTSGPGGIGGVVTLSHSILARSIVWGSDTDPRPIPIDCRQVISEGHNLFGTLRGCQVTLQPTDLVGDPGLGELIDDGRPGFAHVPLLATSRAIDAGASCTEPDQLGQPRWGPCDLGAVEWQRPSAPGSQNVAVAVRVNRQTLQPGDTVVMSVGLENPGPAVRADVFVGLLRPDGTLLFLGGGPTRIDANPATFTPILADVEIPAGLGVPPIPVLSYTFGAGDSPGTAIFFMLLTPPGVFSGAPPGPGDLDTLVIDAEAVAFVGGLPRVSQR